MQRKGHNDNTKTVHVIARDGRTLNKWQYYQCTLCNDLRAITTTFVARKGKKYVRHFTATGETATRNEELMTDLKW